MTINDLTKANKGLHLADLAKANRDRCHEVYHPIDEWSPTDWACAMAGECGEACNLVKKLRRRFEQFENFNPNDVTLTAATHEILGDIASEVADTVIYADLLCQRLGISLEDAIRGKFNATSEEVGSDIRL